MYISYDYYRIFYYIAKYGSFTQAANILLNNQPNLTRAMKALESELGCKLLNRSNKGVTLTPEGEVLYSHVSVAFEHIQAGEDEVSLGKSLKKGVVSIGATEISLRCFLLPILNEFRLKHPGIKIKISNLSTTQSLQALKDGFVDFAIVTTPIAKNSDYAVTKVKSFTEVPICGEAFKEKLIGRTVNLKELNSYPLVSLDRNGVTYPFYMEIFSKNGLNYSPDIEVATADQIIPVVRQNLGIGFVSEEFLEEEQVGIHKIKLNLSMPKRDICIVTKKSHSLSMPAKELGRIMNDSINIK